MRRFGAHRSIRVVFEYPARSRHWKCHDTPKHKHTHRHTLVGEHAHTTPHSIQLFQLSPVNCAATIARPRAGAPSARPAYGRHAQIEMCNQFLVDQVRKFVESIDGGIGHTLTAANHVIVR